VLDASRQMMGFAVHVCRSIVVACWLARWCIVVTLTACVCVIVTFAERHSAAVSLIQRSIDSKNGISRLLPSLSLLLVCSLSRPPAPSIASYGDHEYRPRWHR